MDPHEMNDSDMDVETGDDSPTFESRLARLRDIVQRLERELPLEEGVALYKEGLALAAACRNQLSAAQNEVQVAREGALVDLEEYTAKDSE